MKSLLKTCPQQLAAFFSSESVRSVAVLAFLLLTTNVHAQGLRGLWKTNEEAPNEFIIPPDENPEGISPAHWGLVDKKTMPAEIPSLQQPPQPTSRWTDYEPTTLVGAYRPSQSNAPTQHQPVQQNGAYYPPYAGPLEQTNPVPTGSSLLRITEEEEAFQPSPFHVKEKSPSLGEILKTGAWFASYESMILVPHFQSNTGITTVSAGDVFSRNYDFDFQHAPLVNAGFESKKGPGMMLTYWQIDANSDVASAVVGGSGSAFAAGLSAGPGERLTTQHSLNIHSLTALVFKEMKMPVSRLNGTMGFRYVDINQVVAADLYDAANNRVVSSYATSDFSGLGPTVGMEYYRPIGHTHIEFLGGGNMALLYGHRDEIFKSGGNTFRSYGADAFIAYLDARLGAQWVRDWGQKYRVFVRGTLQSQVWLGSGSGGSRFADFSDFGMFGIGLGFGLNH